MKKTLTLKDFKRIHLEGTIAHYFEFETKDFVICMESCLGGYCVAIYDVSREHLLEEKFCTDHRKRNGVAGLIEIYDKAIKKAQQYYDKYSKI